MSPETFFSIANASVLPGWALLIFLPRWSWTTRLVTTVLIPGLLAVAYAVYLIPNIGEAEGGFGSLPDVMALFSDPRLVLAGWLHYLAFDLLVGTLIVRDAIRERVPHLAVVPCLAACFMAGPLGWLLYLVVRGTTRRKLLFDAVDAVV